MTETKNIGQCINNLKTELLMKKRMREREIEEIEIMLVALEKFKEKDYYIKTKQQPTTTLWG